MSQTCYLACAEQSDEWVTGMRNLNMEELVDIEAEAAVADREVITVT